MIKFKNNNNSFSMIEVLIFITILTLFFIAATTVTTASLRNMKINEHKILASKYADELLEWLRSKKETDWDFFNTKVNSASNKVYCFNSTLLNYDFSDLNNGWFSEETSNNCTGRFNSLDPAIYDRQVHLEGINQGTCGLNSGLYCQIKVSIEVKWQELGTSYSVPVSTIFSIWEK